MKKIVLTGGGTAGHVTPNIALIKGLVNSGYEVHYIGQRNSIEERLITSLDKTYKVKYHRISAGKLRRNITVKTVVRNFTDMFKVVIGLVEARGLIATIEPSVIFSKGGYVAVPVVLAGKMANVPVVVHESDYTPGLTNKISLPLAENICVSFTETATLLEKSMKKRPVVTGTPIRKNILDGDKMNGRKLCGFKKNGKPKVLVMGGSQGAKSINEKIHELVEDGRLDDFNIIHLVGKNNIDFSIKRDNYIQFEYLNNELADIYAYADLVISRAGANTIFELLELAKPHVLIPLPKGVSRGDQIDNANSFRRAGYSVVLEEEDITNEKLVDALIDLRRNSEKYSAAMSISRRKGSIDKIIGIINASFEN